MITRTNYKPIRMNCYVRILATGRVGRVSGKARHEGAVLWGVDWGSEYPWADLERITPAEYHATPDALKIGPNNPSY